MAVGLGLASCGIKGPPLPPMSESQKLEQKPEPLETPGVDKPAPAVPKKSKKAK